MAPPAPQVGDRFDTFELIEAIGSGGMGTVYHAHDQSLDRQVALKLLPTEQIHDSDAVQRFYQEARAAARLDHENIARVYLIGHEEPFHFIAFEFVEGVNIRQLVNEGGRLPVADAVNYALQIAGALVHAAERGVVHRDIKPSNIIVTPQGRAKLVDMGLARRFERGEGGNAGLTQTGMTLGTFDYISPEQAHDPRDVDVRSDLYSLGCTLFHMLAGQPPYPDGTVLQKLLQHREEPVPDVRRFNASVPDELAAILQKLMAKNRDRRYQSPEQLGRDLLRVGHALGLRSSSPEGLVWLGAEPMPRWERHLIWGLPAAAFAGFLGFLFWWNQGRDEGPGLPRGVPAAVRPALVRPPAPGVAPGGRVAAASKPAPEKRPAPERRVPARPADLVEEVSASEDLARLIEEAPAGSTLVLMERGPYDLPLRTAGAVAKRQGSQESPAAGPFLTIRAAAGVRPVLRAGRENRAGASGDGGELKPGLVPPTLLSFARGTLALEGLEFQLDGSPAQGMAALELTGTELHAHRCVFRGGKAGSGSTAIRAVNPEPGVELTLLQVTESHFDAGVTALDLEGAADVLVRDCTFGPAAPSILLEEIPARARITVQHASFLAGASPLFRLVRAGALVRVSDSVFSPADRQGEAVLVSTDQPARLEWRGRGNLYSKFGTFLQTPTGSTTGPIREFEQWVESPDGVSRELDVARAPGPIWVESDPVGLLARELPSQAFHVDPEVLPSEGTGARRGPYGPIDALAGAFTTSPIPLLPEPVAVAAADPQRREPGASPGVNGQATSKDAPRPGGGFEPMTVAPMTVAPMTVAPEQPEGPGATPPVGAITTQERGVPDRVNEPGEASERPVGAPRPGAPESLPGANEPVVAVSPAERNGGDPGRSRTIRTVEELKTALAGTGGAQAPIEIEPGIELELPSLLLEGAGRWVIEGAKATGKPRPRLRFRPGATATDRSCLFEVRSGTLELRNVEVILEGQDAPEAGTWGVARLVSGAELVLDQAIVTIASSGRSRSALAWVGPADSSRGIGGGNESASIRLVDTLARVGLDVVNVAPRYRIDLRASHSVIVAGGVVVHATGTAGMAAGPTLAIDLTRVVARAQGGLAWLESAAGMTDAALPVLDMHVRHSILATDDRGGPLIRVDGQADPEALRDRVRWEGQSVAYHRIDTYRRDQTQQPGEMPLSFTRPDWEVAVARDDRQSYHGSVEFSRAWDDSRPVWTIGPDDLALVPGGASAEFGPDMQRIPRPQR